MTKGSCIPSFKGFYVPGSLICLLRLIGSFMSPWLISDFQEIHSLGYDAVLFQNFQNKMFLLFLNSVFQNFLFESFHGSLLLSSEQCFSRILEFPTEWIIWIFFSFVHTLPTVPQMLFCSHIVCYRNGLNSYNCINS